MKVFDTYKKLLKYFGPQGWWPIFDTKSQSCRYFTIGCRTPYSKFEICVGAILTQNTAWKNVEKALVNLHKVCERPERPRACRGGVEGPQIGLTPQFILSCKNLEKLIQPVGYYNQKAKKLRIFSEWWLKIHPKNLPQPLFSKEGGDPFKKEGAKKYTSPFEKGGLRGILSARKELLSLWGIGPETADSMLLYAFNKPVFVLDAYTKRLCKECDIEFKKYDEYRNFFESQLPKSTKLFNEYHALIVAWGKLHSKNKKSALKIIK